MTAPALAPDATRCPACRAALDGPSGCSTCGLLLTGPPALRLWEVDTELLRLYAHRGELLVERAGLLAALRPAGARDLSAYAGSLGAPPVQAAPASPLPAPRQEWTPQRVQNLLLGLGGLLLTVAALVFAAVTYDRLGAGGRAGVLVLLTAVAATAAPRLRTRGLEATAETVGVVTLVLAALDAYGLRTLGLAKDSDPLLYSAGSAAVLAVVAAAYASAVPLRLVRGAAVVLAQLPVPLVLLARAEDGGVAGLALAAQAAVGLAVLAAARGRLPRPYVPVTAACAALAGTVALLVSLGAALGDEPRTGALALLGCTAVLVAAAVLAPDAVSRALLSGGAVPVLGTAAYALTRDEQQTATLVLAAVGLLAALAAAQLPRAWRPGPVLGALTVSAGSVLTVAGPVASAALVPLTWLVDPWTLSAGVGARGALGPGNVWTGTAVTAVVLLAAALAVATTGLALHRERAAAVPAAVLGGLTAVVLPLGLDLAFPAALGLLLALAAALVAGAAVLTTRSPAAAGVLAATGTGLALLASVWSTASQGSTLVVLPLAALVVGALAATRVPQPALPVAVAGLLATAALAAAGAAQGLSADQVGGLLLVAVAALLGAAVLLDVRRRTGAEVAGGVAGLVAVLLASGDTGWLSWVLSGLGLLALATALRSDRRLAAPAGALLLAASSWVRLADAGVTAPEPYVLPLAALALALGHLRRRAVPGTTSWAAYGPALTSALVPSLLASFDDAVPTRALLLGLAALVVLLLGARSRLQAPLVVAGAVLAVDALQLLAPYAAALPRWMSLGVAGVLLVVVGATYEQRLRDVGRLRDRFDALA